MIRKATKRKASSSDFAWDADNGGAMCEYPYLIPGYPGDLNVYITPMENNPDENCPWNVTATYFSKASGYNDSVDIDCWNILGFIPEDETLESVEQAVENLDPYDFSHALDDMGLEPLVDENGDYVTASRKGKHMIRRADEKTDTRIVENEDGTFTAYCEGDKKTFDDKGKAAEWLADHFNDEYHDKADARRAARRRMMMRAAARRAAMRRQAARKAADDDDRKDKGFDVSYDKDGKIHVHFDDGSDMDFDDMHDFADFVEGPDADEKPVDKEEAARARHAARVAMMRRRAARVASRPVARHAMRNDDGHPYL